MQSRSTVILLTCFLLWPQATPQPIIMPVQNPSFEEHGISTSDGIDQCGQHYYNVPGWQFSSGSVLKILPNVGAPYCGLGVPPDGSYAAGAGWGSTISQDVGHTLPGDGVYKLTFYVGDYFYWYAGTYKAALLINGSEFCSTSGYAMGDFTEATIVCPSQRTSGEIKIVFTGTNLNGFPVLFAGPISLTFTSVSQ